MCDQDGFAGFDHLALVLFQEVLGHEDAGVDKRRDAEDPTDGGDGEGRVVIHGLNDVERCLDANEKDEDGNDGHTYFDWDDEAAIASVLGELEAIFVDGALESHIF